MSNLNSISPELQLPVLLYHTVEQDVEHHLKVLPLPLLSMAQQPSFSLTNKNIAQLEVMPSIKGKR